MANEFCLNPSQLYYLRSVLGIDAVVLPSSVEFSAVDTGGSDTEVHWSGIAESAPMIALFPLVQGEFPLSSEAEIMIERMFRAMKLEPSEVLTAMWPVESEQLLASVRHGVSEGGHVPVVLFGSEVAHALTSESCVPGEVVELDGRRVFVTFSLNELMQVPDRKRQAWVHLQTVMKEL